MRVPISWLRQYVALPAEAGAIAERLAMLGFPVADITTRPPITGVLTGKIVTLEKHPNADRLHVAKIDVAGPHPLTIATAATNVAAGQTIAVATVGATLPQLKIERRTMRGVVSDGMMISADELALPPEWFEDGILQLDAGTPVGVNAVELFGLDTAVLDVEITSNRPDAMSVIGLARELAASYDVAVQLPSFENPANALEPAEKAPKVFLESPDCHRFVAQRFERILVQPAPAWMRIRLALAGQRPINNLVDVSNYVMLETGQPLHIYDADRLAGGRLTVRSARDAEKIVTLDNVERTLDPRALLIADDGAAVCIAGIMGGADTEVSAQTSAIVVEAANFDGPRIRRASNALSLRSEASARHEKSLAPALTDMGAARAAQLLLDLGATGYQPHAFGADALTAEAIALPVHDVKRLLGMHIPPERIGRHLTALGCTVAPIGGDAFAVTPPSWRRDLTIASDLIEEVARIEGYDKIEAVVPSVPPHQISSAAFDLETKAAAALASLGYREVIGNSLHGAARFARLRSAGITMDRNPVEVRNPLSEEQRFLRDSMLPGLIEYLAKNPQERIFEIGQIFWHEGGAIVERTALAYGFAQQAVAAVPWQDAAFLRLKGDCEAFVRHVTGRRCETLPGAYSGLHPGKSADVRIGGDAVGHLGCVDPRLSKALGLDGDAYVCLFDVTALPPYVTPQYRPPSKYPSTYRDIAFVVGSEVSAREIEQTAAASAGPLCTGVTVFDEYRGPQVGEGRKSLATRLTLQRFDTTITDAEADGAVAAVVDAMHDCFGATVRA